MASERALVAPPPGVAAPAPLPVVASQSSDGGKPKKKWARRQASELKKDKYREEGLQEYNIWYDKYIGDYDRYKEREAAATRCNPKVDCGRTKADLLRPDSAYICLHFARGNCVKGPECMFLHRLPNDQDEARIDLLHDIFGRTRHSTDRDDMGGSGNFNRECKTLYISDFYMPPEIHSAMRENEQGKAQGQHHTYRLVGSEDSTVKPKGFRDYYEEVVEVLAKHFGEWGAIQQINIKPRIGCGFVRYFNRTSAEFAKVAMAEQQLEHGEQLNVRWAYDDPNPQAGRELEEQRQMRMLYAMVDKGQLPDTALDKLKTPLTEAQERAEAMNYPHPWSQPWQQQQQLQAQQAAQAQDGTGVEPAAKRHKTNPAEDAAAYAAQWEAYQQAQYAQEYYAQQSIGYYSTDGTYVYTGPTQPEQPEQQQQQPEVEVGPAGPHQAQAQQGKAQPSKEEQTRTAIEKMNALLGRLDATQYLGRSIPRRPRQRT